MLCGLTSILNILSQVCFRWSIIEVVCVCFGKATRNGNFTASNQPKNHMQHLYIRLIQISFWFKYGALIKPGKSLIFCISFQFQYGTIKTINKTVEQYYNDLFQFQYGTIKTWKISENPLSRVNLSIPVWYN